MKAPQFPTSQLLSHLTRREMLRRCSLGFGSLALSALWSEKICGAAAPAGMVLGPHFKPRAKHVIFAYMSGGVSHLDSFDPKPELKKRHGLAMIFPTSLNMVGFTGTGMGCPWRFFNSGFGSHESRCDTPPLI